MTSLETLEKAGPIVRFLAELRTVGGLSGVDVANFTGVSKATVSRWASGAMKPQPATQLFLSDLHYIVGRLEDYYTPEEIRAWLYARHPQLEGERAIDVVAQGQSERVLAVIDRLDADVYL
ncbi:MAG: helix-turn-helix domain-containing protein [Alphaproteobacteria bacterium]|nr:helix-turn-helix domain-containing protein [Alphaproteobacteria bacterium]